MLVIRDAWRHLLRAPRVPLAMAAVLTLGFGSASALFAVVNTLILSPVRYPAGDRLVTMAVGARVWSLTMLDAVAESNSTFELLAGVHERSVHFDSGAGPMVLRLEAVSPAYFQLLNVHIAAGRGLSPADDAVQPSRVCLVSDALWRRAFAAEPLIVGRTLSLEGTSVQVVGILPPHFSGLVGRTDIWIPLRLARHLGVQSPGPDRPFSRWFEVVGQLKPGASLAQARASFAVDARRAVASIPGASSGLGTRWSASVIPLRQAMSDEPTRRASVVVYGAVVLVLLLACCNFANLQLTRLVSRTRELAVRRAIGASSVQLAALTATETAIIVLTGIAGGLLVRGVMLSAVLALRPAPAGFGLRTSALAWQATMVPDVIELVVLALLGILCWLATGALPALRSFHLSAEPLLRQTAHGPGGLPKLGRASVVGVLVAVQIGLCLTLLAATALMVRTTVNLWRINRGLEPDGVLTMRLQPPAGVYDAASLTALFPEVVDRVGRVPGVIAASISNCAPGSGRCRQTNVREVDGHPLTPASAPTVGVHFVTADHFEVVGTPLISGRAFSSSDRKGAPLTVLVSSSLAVRLWGSQAAVGRQLALYFADGRNTESREVVGIVHDVGFDARAGGPQLDVYLPAAQVAWSSPLLFAKLTESAGLPAILREISAVDSRLAVYDIAPLSTRLGEGFGTERFLTATVTIFGALALCLVAVGLYTAVSHAIAQGRRELAIRLALGASHSSLRNALFLRAGQVVILGVALGNGGIVFVERTISTFLFGTTAHDPTALLAALATVTGVCAAAVGPSVLRISRINPSELLRGDVPLG